MPHSDRSRGQLRRSGFVLLVIALLLLAPHGAIAKDDANVLIENNVVTGALWNFTPDILQSDFSTETGVGMSGARFIGTWPYQHSGFSLGLKGGSERNRRASASYKILDSDTGEVVGGFTLSFKGFRHWDFKAAADLLLHQTKSFVVKHTKSKIKSEIKENFEDLFEDAGADVAAVAVSRSTSKKPDWKKHLTKLAKKAAIASGAFDGLDEVEAAIDVIKEIAKIFEALDPTASVHVEIEDYQGQPIPFSIQDIPFITTETSSPGTVNIQVIGPADKVLTEDDAPKYFVVALGATAAVFPGFIDMSVSPFCDFVCAAWQGTENLLASLAYPAASCPGNGPNVRFVAPGYSTPDFPAQVDLKIAEGNGGWSDSHPTQSYQWAEEGTVFSGWVRASDGITLCKTSNDAEKFVLDPTQGCNQTILVDCSEGQIRWTPDTSTCAYAETIESVPYYKIALDRGAGLVRQNFWDPDDPTDGPALVSGPTEWVCPTPPVLEPWNPTPSSCAGNMSVTFLPQEGDSGLCARMVSSPEQQHAVNSESCAQQFIDVPHGTLFGGELVEWNSTVALCGSPLSGGHFTVDAANGCNQVVYLSCSSSASDSLIFEPVDLSLECGITDPLSLLPATCKDSICGSCSSKDLPDACPSSSVTSSRVNGQLSALEMEPKQRMARGFSR